LDSALKELREEGCMQEALYNALVGNNVKLNFGMYTNVTETSAAAAYDPNYKSIKFRDKKAITKESLKEELFHALQDVYYPGGIAQYGKDKQGNKLPGFVNIEFEAKVFKDIIESPDVGCCWAFKDVDDFPKNLSDEYIRWIYGIREFTISLEDADYQKWLNFFNQYDREYTSPMHSDLSTPNAIRNLINLSNCY
jgi:hypothetical protein